MNIQTSFFENIYLNEDKTYIIESGFNKEIFDALVCDIDQQMEKIKEETLKLKNFLGNIKENKEKYLKEFNKHNRIYNVLQHYVLYKYRNDYFELIEQFKTPYNRDIQENINEFTKKYGKNNTKKFIEYLHSYGRYEYALNKVARKLIDLGMAQELDLGKRRHMIEEGNEKGTIVFTSEENDIVIQNLPKTPYYKKKVKIPEIIISTFNEDNNENIF